MLPHFITRMSTGRLTACVTEVPFHLFKHLNFITSAETLFCSLTGGREATEILMFTAASQGYTWRQACGCNYFAGLNRGCCGEGRSSRLVLSTLEVLLNTRA